MFSPNFFVMSDVWSISCIGLMCQRCARMFVRVWIRQKVSVYCICMTAMVSYNVKKIGQPSVPEHQILCLLYWVVAWMSIHFLVFIFPCSKGNALRMELCTISWNPVWQQEIKNGGMTSAVLSYICIKPASFSVKDAWTMAIIRPPGLTHVSCATPISVGIASNMKYWIWNIEPNCLEYD